jgi:uncharacterized phiE125 gp8 family phage protein
MSLSETALVTLNQAKNYLRKDAAASLEVTAEYVGMGTGSLKTFTLDHIPLSGSLQLYVNGVLQVEATHFTISGATITFIAAPTLNYPITASYSYAAGSETFEGFDDALLEALIDAATKKAEEYTERAFIERSITENHYGDGTEILMLYRRPVVEITKVTLDGTELEVDSDYSELPQIARLKRTANWPSDYLITVEYDAGFGETREEAQAAVPEAVAAVLMTVANWYENRLGLKSESVTGVGSVDYGEADILPPGAKKLLESLKV